MSIIHFTSARRVLLIELAGASSDVLVPMADSAPMPNLARLLESSALVRLENDGPLASATAWATLATGAAATRHGRFDEQFLDHRRGRIVPWGDHPLLLPTPADRIAAADPDAVVAPVDDSAAGPSIWRRRPTGLDELAAGIARTSAAMRGAVARALAVDRAGAWRLLRVRFTVLDGLLQCLWHLLGIGGGPGGNARFVAKTREAFYALDACLGQLLELAESRRAATIAVSPFGFEPFREKINVSELLRRRDLLQVARGAAAVPYRLARLAAKLRPQCSETPVAGLAPIDWRRSRAVTLHGHSAALVYLNTPERFGGRAPVTPGRREQTVAEVAAALADARHPSTGEPLFVRIDRVAEQGGIDPLQRRLPDVVGIPAAGFHVRHRPDRNRRLMRRDATIPAARSGEGLLMIHGADSSPARWSSAPLTDVAAIVLDALGLPPEAKWVRRDEGNRRDLAVQNAFHGKELP